MATIIGSARISEKGTVIGNAGDQKQTKVDDYKGEVSMQYLKDFIGSRKYYVIRPKKAAVAIALSESMKLACNNIKIGYSQTCQRTSVDDLNTKTKINVDCSKLVRDCIYRATKKDVGNFTTANEKAILEASGFFDKAIPYTASMKIYQGDIFVTTTRGHTGICIEGAPRVNTVPILEYKYNGIDFSKVFDPIYYSENNEDLRKAYGTNTTLLFNHFIKFGCNESSRWGKTIKNFNVYKYATSEKNEDLRKAFGKLQDDGKNGYAFYAHYCMHGYKENRICN